VVVISGSAPNKLLHHLYVNARAILKRGLHCRIHCRDFVSGEFAIACNRLALVTQLEAVLAKINRGYDGVLKPPKWNTRDAINHCRRIHEIVTC
jgi:hypothetical protein